ncbi:polysaccharide deacetylase family protein [Symbiobacterium thermophilum]|uniref:polysaccharide deacetylase family protein n=1 Tax=Symbiobacterium thermophilum TaxID=2734 RepID=UPI0035C7358A
MPDPMTLLLLTLFGYTGLPTLLARTGFHRALTGLPAVPPQVALTFDDGPDPVWTPRILEILDRFGVRATFFMLGSRAEAHPDLVRQVAAAGHEVGVHGYRHRPAALQGLRSTLADVEATVRVLTGILQRRPRYYRPPWGIFNLWTGIAARRHRLIPVVWSLHVAEWSRATTAHSIYLDAMRRAKPGTVLLLHDAAGPGSRPDAPAVVARALPRVIAGLRRRGLTPVSLSELLEPAERRVTDAPPGPDMGSPRP